MLVGKPEECGFHAECKYHQDKCCIGIEIGDDAIASACGRDDMCVEWDKQIIEKASHNTGQSVDGRVLGQRFYICHIFLSKEDVTYH